MERSACAFFEPRIVFSVKATSEARTGSPSENLASSRNLKVQVSLSSEHS